MPHGVRSGILRIIANLYNASTLASLRRGQNGAANLKKQASRLTSQINTLVYAMGDETDDILTSLNLNEAQERKYNVGRQKFDGYFIKRRNPIFECVFNHLKQEEGEPVDSIITALHCLAEYCGYEEVHNEMIRDRLVVGLCDAI